MLEKFMNVFFKAPRQLDELRPKGPGYHLEFCKSFICEKGFQCKVMILYDGGDRTGLISNIFCHVFSRVIFGEDSSGCCILIQHLACFECFGPIMQLSSLSWRVKLLF